MRVSQRALLGGALLAAALALIATIWWFVYLAHPAPPTLDQRVADVASRLRCPICQGESVEDSPSELAQQMRAVIRQQLLAGRSEQQVIQYFVDRYGEQILWEPPQQGFSLLVWLMPFALLLAGALLICFVLREWQQARLRQEQLAETVPSVSDEELERYRAELEAELAADDVLFRPAGREREVR
jgi:cytochrome c-type biogenesis protein CcmH